MTEPAQAPEGKVGSTAPATPPKPPLPPSPPWYGGVAIGLIALMAAIMLTYTLLDWDWQQRFGAWNYVVTAALIPVASVMVRRWRPDVTR